ncbi:MAG: class I SAM-dependent methyltransferase [Oscillospiraceae bacterium]|nr:class I SAM-dependent methyltransferase [Oscillospiraceae bacterium]
MGLFKNYVSQTRKPEGALGKVMIAGMNSGHAKMADWGMSHLPKCRPSQIAELGCGGGRNIAELLKKYPDAHVTGIDYSPLSVQKSAEYNQPAVASGRCTIQEGNVQNLLLPENQFDFATAFETVYFWGNLENAFRQVHKILKPDGFFLIVNESDGHDDASLKFEQIIDGMKCYTAEQIADSLKKAGFSRCQSAHHPEKPWIVLLAEK